MRDYFGKEQAIRFIFPIDGDCINENDGERIVARVEAPEGRRVTICGKRADFCDGYYCAEVEVKEAEVLLRAVDENTEEACEIRVFRLKNPVGGYRISSDDNIIFLWDLNEHKDEYSSIFENPYLAIYKKAHDLYGAKVHLNLFYAFDDVARTYFKEDRPYFDLSMMTDKFRDEFRANAHWLKFSFHSKSEMPDAPYQNADGETVREDCLCVHREIIRFAGEECLSNCTTVHWGAATEDGVRALRDLGYRTLTGYFTLPKHVAYYAPEELVAHIYGRDFWKDTAIDMLFGRIDLVLNCNTHEQNMKTVEDIMASPTRGGFVSLMIHEQYFHKDYWRHLPDFEARVLEPCALLAKAGYEGRHIAEVLNG